MKQKLSAWDKGDVSSENPNLAGRGALSEHLDADTINYALLTEHRGLRELTPLAAADPACNKSALPSNLFKPANRLLKIDVQNNSSSFWGSAFQLVLFTDVCAALRLELDGSRQDICSSYPPGALHKVDSLSSSHGPSGSAAGTIPSPNTIRKRDLFIQPFKARIRGR